MSRNQISFAFAGLLFGFLLGFVVAHQIYAGRGIGFRHPPVPAGVAAGPAPGGRGGAGGGGAPMDGAASGDDGGTATMEQVGREIAALKDLLEKDPRNVQALTRLGNLYFDAGMFDKAQGYYEQALAAVPDDVNVQTDLGTSLRNTGKPEEAMKHFEAAVARDPAHWRGWFNIGIVALYDLGDYDRAQKAFDRVASLNPGALDMTALKQEIDRVRAERASRDGAS
jgi:predicted TPR repeat methyltransferase